MDDCPFCAVAAGHAPEPEGLRWLSQDDQDVMAFTPLRPFTPGHTLVVPVAHVTHMAAADQRTLSGVMAAVQDLVRHDPILCDGWNVITSIGEAATQTVMHWHVHVIPRHAGDALGRWPWDGAS